MVELNFDRRRPERVLDLTGCRSWPSGRRRRRRVIGGGVTYTRIVAGDGGGPPGPRHRLPHRRFAADPQPGDRRRQRRDLVAGRRRAAAPDRLGRVVEARVGDRHAHRPARGVLQRPQAQRDGAGRADPRRPGARRRAAPSGSPRWAPATRWSSPLLLRRRVDAADATSHAIGSAARHRIRAPEAEAFAGVLDEGATGRTARRRPTPRCAASASWWGRRPARSTTCADGRLPPPRAVGHRPPHRRVVLGGARPVRLTLGSTARSTRPTTSGRARA